MKSVVFALALSLGIANSATAQSIHPPTREGFGAKADSPETQRERKPESSPADRPEAQGGANSQLNREYGKNTQPDGNRLPDGQPQASR